MLHGRKQYLSQGRYRDRERRRVLEGAGMGEKIARKAWWQGQHLSGNPAKWTRWGRDKDKHSDNQAVSSKPFLGQSNGPVWLEDRTWHRRGKEGWEKMLGLGCGSTEGL